MWGRSSGLPRGLHALDRDSPCYSRWEEGANSSGKRQWVQAEMGHRTQELIHGDVFRHTDQQALTDVSCGLSLVPGAGYAGPAPALSLGQMRDSVGKRWGPGEP